MERERITQEQIESLYEYGKKVYNEELLLNKAVKEFCEKCQVSEASAEHYIGWYSAMRNGEYRTWNSNTELMIYYAQKIKSEHGFEEGKKAVVSIKKYADYKDSENLLKKIEKNFPEYLDVLQDDVKKSDEYNAVKKQNSFEQKIFFGAPGTGKSHRIDAPVRDGGLGLKTVSKDQKFRTAFHPDYDYAQFVGAYKPVMLKGDDGKPVFANGAPIVGYRFVPQVFARAYAAAWSDLHKPIYLVIEEINRGNCAQIFGDIFQLLDRNSMGYSEYSIDVDSDFSDWLCGELGEEKWKCYVKHCYVIEKDGLPETVLPVSEDKIALPPNFHILATMNTSDQSLFPMDSAFKRRFDWQYIPIKYEKNKDPKKEKNPWEFTVEIEYTDGKEKLKFEWIDFLEKVNDDIYLITESEDKQMGEFFVNPKNKVINREMFLSKVLFYLWDSVYKDESNRPDNECKVFHFVHPKDVDKKEDKKRKVTFQSLFKNNGADAVEIIKQMLKKLEVAYEPGDENKPKGDQS